MSKHIPAFPQPYERASDGMSLRDWFAGQSLSGICSNHEWLAAVHGRNMSVTETAAASAYEYADAMLAQRERPTA